MRDDQESRLERALRRRWEERLGEYAVRQALITEAQLQEATEEVGRAPDASLSRVLVDRTWLTREEVDQILATLKASDFSRPDPERPLPPLAREAVKDPTRTLAEFVLTTRLGVGGAAEVWKSWDRLLGRWVAIKVPRFLPESRTAAERFKREALAAARLAHPNIIPIHRVAEENGRPYLVMHYVEGRTLHEERLPLRRAVEIMRDVAIAVQYAHGQGVIHRDIKPMNLIVDTQGRPWIFDFGLVFLPEEARQLTLPGTVVGTPSYMSPEQASGGDQAHSPATDIYGLGATLYDLATGQPPFPGNSLADIVLKVKTEDPISPTRLKPELAPDLERVILKAMDKDPLRRYGSAADFSEDLDRYLKGEPVRGRPLSTLGRLFRRASRYRTLLALGVVLTALSIGVGLWAGRTSSRIPGPEIAPLPDPAPIVLLPDEAVLHGETMMLSHTGEERHIAGWNSSRCSAEWFVSAPRAGWYKVEILYSAAMNNGGKYILATEKDQWTGNLLATGSWEKYQTMSLGTVYLSKEQSRLILKAAEVSGGLCNLKSMRLTPQ